MRHNSETIADDNGIEVIVGYEYDTSESQVEECHGLHDVGCTVFTQLKNVEVVIGGIGIDILPVLSKTQKQFIISKLQYD